MTIIQSTKLTSHILCIYKSTVLGEYVFGIEGGIQLVQVGSDYSLTINNNEQYILEDNYISSIVGLNTNTLIATNYFTHEVVIIDRKIK